MPAGRRSKLTPERGDKIVKLIKGGNYVQVACAAVGISEKTFYNWATAARGVEGRIEQLADGAYEAMLEGAEDFHDIEYPAAAHWLPGLTEHEWACFQLLQAVKVADAEAESEAVLQIKLQWKDQWTAAMTFLERRHPGRWKRRDLFEVAAADADAEQRKEALLLNDPEAVELMHDALERAASKGLPEKATGDGLSVARS